MAGLGIDDFGAFFRAVHDRDPFPWQERLLQEVMEEGWPALCDLPPAAGKTALIDIAVFGLACDASNVPRRMPLRVCFTVDRRLVVDDAYNRARLIAEKLRAAHGGPETAGREGWVLAEVARRLASIGGVEEGRPPLQVAVLRGGLPRDNGWVESVRQPTVVLSTVDQVGSRLLMRGYGVSARMAPVHAGLLGEDCLFALDEAHLSAPFAETLETVQSLRAHAVEPLGLPFAAVTLTATPDAGATGRVFRLDMSRDGPDRAGVPALDRRFAAAKRTRMGTAPPRDLDKQARIFADYAKECLRRSGVRVVGVVVNRVRLARKIHDLLAEEFGEVGGDPAAGGALLLTGRCRPFERDMLLGLDRQEAPPFERVIDRIRTGRDRGKQAPHQAMFVVGTQAIEAGADLDFDALVTEVASWPSLRQRFGRLDRAGELGETPAWIVRTHDPSAKDPGAADQVYGAAGWNTCRWLWMLCGGSPVDKAAPAGSIDMGVDGQAALGEVPAGLSPDVRHAPRLTPAILDLFAQTSPRPAPDPDPALWLHGPSGGPAEVQVVWRADAPANQDEAAWEAFTDVLALVPPTSSEVLPLPVWSARTWLSNLNADGADIESADLLPDVKPDRADKALAAGQVFVWRGADRSGLVSPGKVEPGDTVVLPAARGGCDRFGWVPGSEAAPTPTRDLASEAITRARGRAVVRVHPAVLGEDAWKRAKAALSGLEEAADDAEAFAALAGVLPADVVARLGTRPACARYGVELVEGVAFVGRPQPRAERSVHVRPDLLDDDERAMLALGQVPLPLHCEGVGQGVDAACRAVGLRDELRADATLAGGTHDVGKAEPRFKAMLWNTDFIAALGRPPLAKSVAISSGRNDWSRSAGRVTLPNGARHECWSVAMLAGSELLEMAHDPDLVLWLVGVHHGHGRPFFEPVADPQPVVAEVELDFTHHGRTVRLRGPVRHGLAEVSSGWADRFDAMLARYGCWGLAYLEAVVRLADARQSRQEEALMSRTENQDLFAGRGAA